jgi:hypothetical protein
LPDSQAGKFRSLELRSFLASHDQQRNSSGQRQSSEDRRDRNMLLLVRGGMDGPEIENFFSMGIIESLIREGQAAKNNQ